MTGRFIPTNSGRKAGEALAVSVRIAPLDGQILSLAVTEVAHALHKGIGKRIAIRRARTRARCQKPDAPTFGILLRTRSNRPGCHRAAKMNSRRRMGPRRQCVLRNP